jgi:hypothetical protein
MYATQKMAKKSVVPFSAKIRNLMSLTIQQTHFVTAVKTSTPVTILTVLFHIHMEY